MMWHKSNRTSEPHFHVIQNRFVLQLSLNRRSELQWPPQIVAIPRLSHGFLHPRFRMLLWSENGNILRIVTVDDLSPANRDLTITECLSSSPRPSVHSVYTYKYVSVFPDLLAPISSNRDQARHILLNVDYSIEGLLSSLGIRYSWDLFAPLPCDCCSSFR